MNGEIGVRRVLVGVAAAVVVLLALALPSGAAAAGPLTFESCISQPAHDPCSAAPAGSLASSRDVVVNPAGTDVYVIGAGIASHFKRATDGTLTYADCASDSGANGCTDLDGAPLAGARDGVLSPNGKHLYVSADATIATLKVSATGSLSSSTAPATPQRRRASICPVSPSTSASRSLSRHPATRSMWRASAAAASLASASAAMVIRPTRAATPAWAAPRAPTFRERP